MLFPNMSFQMMGGVQGWNLTDVTIMLEVGALLSVLNPVMREMVISMLAIGIERTAVGHYRFLGHNEWPAHNDINQGTIRFSDNMEDWPRGEMGVIGEGSVLHCW